MTTTQCPHCNAPIEMKEGQPVRFCPFCGKTLAETKPAGPSELEKRVAAEKRPQKKYEIIMAAIQAAPEDFEANKALLYHGRLHEPMARGRTMDFSIIKSHLLSVFDEPEKYTAAELNDKFEELLRDPQLQKTMALAADADVFFSEYIYKMAYDYVDLFIRGDSKYASVAFGFGRSAESLARRCSAPVKRMLAEVRRSGRLTESERMLLLGALREAYERVFTGYAAFLQE